MPHHHDHHEHHHHYSFSFRWIFEYSLKGWDIEEGKELFIFTCFLLGSGLYLILLGAYFGDLHLISEGFHTWFHSLCVWAALLALVYEYIHSAPDKKSSFGYDRVQIVAAFGNAMFAVFIALFEIFEILHSLSSSEGDADNFEISLFFVLKILAQGLVCYHLKDYRAISGERSPKQENFGVLLIHVMGLLVVDTITLLTGVLQLHTYGFPLNALDSMLIVAWLSCMVYLLVPYINRNSRVLLLCSPTGKQRDMVLKKMREVSFVEGVAQVKDEKIWMLTSKKLVGSVTLRVHEDADCLAITENATEILSSVLDIINVEVSP